MKLMFISDLHGSAYYAKKLSSIWEKENPDKIVSVGDLLYHGPRNDFPKDYDTKAVTSVLNSQKDKIIAVRGNCDSEVDQMVLEFPMMADYTVINADGIDIFVTHGHLYSPDNLPKMEKGVFISGHIHIPVCEKKGNITILNPGSASLPKENKKPSYMLYENKCFKIIEIETGKIIKSVEL